MGPASVFCAPDAGVGGVFSLPLSVEGEKVEISWGVVDAVFFLFLMPPTRPSTPLVSGHKPADLKCSTADLAAFWRAAFLVEKSSFVEPNFWSSPSKVRVQENLVPRT